MPALFRYVLTALVGLAATAGARAQEAAPGAAQAVRRAAEQVLAERFPESAGRMEVRVRRTGGHIAGGARLQLDFPQHGDGPEGLTQVQVNERTPAGRWQKTGWALLYVARFDSVVTVPAPIRSGEPVTGAKVEVAWLETTRFRGEPLRPADFRALASEEPLVATRMLRAGRALRRGDVRPPYTADTGGAIEMHYTRGPLAFRLTCKAREPGFAHEAIRLYCPGTRATYRARLTEVGTARWIETL